MASEAAEIREAIEETRAQLGETVQALAEKADVKSQVSRKVEQTKERTLAQAQEVAHEVVQTAATVPARAKANKKVALPLALGALGLLLMLLRRHNSRDDGRTGETG